MEFTDSESKFMAYAVFSTDFYTITTDLVTKKLHTIKDNHNSIMNRMIQAFEERKFTT